jgi:hypothetical protein
MLSLSGNKKEILPGPPGPDGRADDWQEALSPGSITPCPTCGGVLFWSDLTGGRHCQSCEAAGLRRALTLAKRAARLRRQTARRQQGVAA